MPVGKKQLFTHFSILYLHSNAPLFGQHGVLEIKFDKQCKLDNWESAELGFNRFNIEPIVEGFKDEYKMKSIILIDYKPPIQAGLVVQSSTRTT